MDADKEIEKILSVEGSPKKGRLKDQWEYRRRIVITTLLFCAFCICYIMFDGADTRVNENIILGCFTLAGSVIGFYVGGATWNDINMEKIRVVETIKKDPAAIKNKQVDTDEK